MSHPHVLKVALAVTPFVQPHNEPNVLLAKVAYLVARCEHAEYLEKAHDKVIMTCSPHISNLWHSQLSKTIQEVTNLRGDDLGFLRSCEVQDLVLDKPIEVAVLNLLKVLVIIHIEVGWAVRRLCYSILIV